MRGRVDGLDERHVHRLLGVPDVGRERRQQRAERVDDREHGLAAPEQPPPDRVVERQREAQQPLGRASRPRARAPSERSRSVDQQARQRQQDEHADDQRHAVGDDVQRRGHPDQPRHQQQAEDLREPEPGARQPPEDERSQRRGQQAHHLDQHKEPERSEHRGRGGYLGRPCRSTTTSRPSPCASRATRSKASSRTVSSGFERKSTIFVLQGGGEEGRGEDVTYEPEAHDAQQQAGPVLELAGEWTFDSFSEHLATLDLVPRLHARSSTSTAATGAGASSRRRWTSRCARPAPRCTSCSAARRSRSRSWSPRGWASRRRSRPSRAAWPVYPDAALQARRDAGLARGADRRAAGDRRGRLDRLQGRLQGHGRRHADRPGLLQAHRGVVPGRLARGPRPRDRGGAQRARRPPGPDHLGRADPLRRGHPQGAGDAAHGQPQAVALRLA